MSQHPDDLSLQQLSKLCEAMVWQFKDEFWFDVTFIYRSHDAASVFLAGDFCGWKTDVHKMAKCEEGFTITLPLSEGFYHYKFYVDGNWVRDEHNPHQGGLFGNSIMFVHMDRSKRVWPSTAVPPSQRLPPTWF